MLKTAALVLLALVVAIGGGGASAWYLLQRPAGIGAVTVGGWTAFPEIGTPDADPYSKARVAREGVLALGHAEGLAYVAQRDSAGDPLMRECRYTIEGSAPASRFWTLYAADQTLSPLPSDRPRPPAIHSNELVMLPDSSVAASIGARPAAGNWLAVSGAGPMSLVLTLYDPPLGSGSGAADIQLPQILKTGCDA